MAYSYGARFDDDSNAITVIDEENQTATTTGYINGEPVDFGGGGSSDFSTAKATLTVNGDGVNVMVPNIAENQGIYYIATAVGLLSDSTEVVDVVLYKGTAVCTIDTSGISVNTSGNITSIDEGVYLITGDCTISIS